MDVSPKIFSFLLIGAALVVETNQEFFSDLISKGPLTQSILNVYCGYIHAPPDEDPLRFSPWMVVLTAKSKKGRDDILKCGATLISGKNAITSDACLRKHKSSSFDVIIGAPSLQQLQKGTRKKVKKINVLLSDQRLAVLNFGYVIFDSTIRPICLQKLDISGIFATTGWEEVKKSGKRKNKSTSKKVAYLELKDFCKIDGYCVEVLPVEEPWEMAAEEIEEGAPLLVEKDSYWYMKGVMVSEEEEEEDGDASEKTDDKNEKKDEKEEKEDENEEKEKDEKEDDKDEKKEESEEGENEKADADADDEKESENDGDSAKEPEDKDGDEGDENEGPEEEKEEEKTDGDETETPEENTDDEKDEEEGEDDRAKRETKSKKGVGRNGGITIRRKRESSNNYDLFFVKITAEIFDELQELTSMLS